MGQPLQENSQNVTERLGQPRSIAQDFKVRDSHPSKTAKGGAPSVVVGSRSRWKGWATRPLEVEQDSY